MKAAKYLIAIILMTFAVITFAQEPAPESATATPPVDSATIKGKIQAPPVQPVEVDPLQLIENIKQVYAGVDNYSCSFRLAIDIPKKKETEQRINQLTNHYKLQYINSNPDPDKYLLRLEGVQGINRHTFVIYSPAGKTEYGYKVYKPGIPDGISLKADDPLVSDVPYARYAGFLSLLEDYARTKDSIELSALFNVKKNIYEIEAIREAPLAKNATGYEKNTIIIDPVTFQLKSWEVNVKRKEKGEYMFRSRIIWDEFIPGGANPDDITSKPHF